MAEAIGESTQGVVSAPWRQRAVDFVRLGRPLHLVGGFVFHGLGISIAHFAGAPVNWALAFWCQVAISSIQLMTHYSNDYFDYEADKASVYVTRWASGSRVLPNGLLPVRVALVAALLLATLALFATGILALASPAPGQTALLLLLSLFLAWSYSSPPLRLNHNGWGELCGAVLVPGLTTLVGFQVQTGAIALLPVLAALPLSCFQFAMLLSVNFPDALGDAVVGKRTLVVKLGGARAARLYVSALLLGYALLPLLVWLGLPALAAAAVLLMSPVALWLAWRIGRGGWNDPAAWNSVPFWNIGLMMATATFEAAAFLVLSLSR